MPAGIAKRVAKFTALQQHQYSLLLSGKFGLWQCKVAAAWAVIKGSYNTCAMSASPRQCVAGAPCDGRGCSMVPASFWAEGVGEPPLTTAPERPPLPPAAAGASSDLPLAPPPRGWCLDAPPLALCLGW